MKYAVIRTGGKQYRISEGDVISVERLTNGKDNGVTFNEVLLYTTDGVTHVGQPMVEGALVQGTVVDDIKGPKIRVAKFKAKARYRRVTGHRQSLTQVKINTIEFGKAKKADKTEEK